ncbi:MAG: helix-turn-helix domain-containing protein [Rhodospirillales bacterium]|nr:helix-turn-helix domain-containing protein [Rhodospirillales bacterium]
MVQAATNSSLIGLALPENRETLLTENEVAYLTRQSPRTLQALRLRGGGPVYLKLGRLIRYRSGDVRAWLESQRRTSTSDPGAPVGCNGP